MTRKNLPIALYMLLVFGSGAVVGGPVSYTHLTALAASRMFLVDR